MYTLLLKYGTKKATEAAFLNFLGKPIYDGSIIIHETTLVSVASLLVIINE